MTAAVEIVTGYYPAIDANDVERILAFFAADAVYERAGARYCGLGSIADFFRHKRQIRGVHKVEGVWPLAYGQAVLAVGEFEGVGAADDEKLVAFVDLWQFNSARLVVRRRTFLALGHAFVER